MGLYQQGRQRFAQAFAQINEYTPDKLEQPADYLTLLLGLFGLTLFVMAALAPYYVFLTVGDVLGASDPWYFSAGCYLMFIVALKYR